jgi:hypothetical protein
MTRPYGFEDDQSYSFTNVFEGGFEGHADLVLVWGDAGYVRDQAGALL